MDTELGRPDTAQHDRLIAELEKRKQSLAPKQGFEGLMEYLGQVSANSQPGRGSFASGAAGARGMDKLNRERQLEQFELSKQAIEVSQKKLDTVRAYAEKRFNVGNAEFDKVYKEQFEAAKDVVKNKADAEKLAKENTLKMLQMENNLEVQRLQNKGSLAAASVRSEGNEGKRQVDALKAELASIDKELAPLLKTPFGPNKAKIAALEAQKAQVQKDLRAAGGVSTMGAAPGAPKGPGGTNQQNWSIKPLQ
jgi:CHASE3 domain sensor protein